MKTRALLPFLTAIGVAASLLPAAADPYGARETFPPSVPPGFAVTLQASTPTATSLSFAPDGSTLYVGAGAQVLAFPVTAGVLAGRPTIYAQGLRQTLGVLALEEGVYMSGIDPAGNGVVYRAPDANRDGVADTLEVVLRELPNGRHNTNGIALGPDGMLYIANGNSTDSGFGAEGGPPEKRPYSGSVLRVPRDARNLEPHPSMVVATGFRNVYDIAFRPGTTLAAVPTNGPDGLRYGTTTRPRGEDTLAIFDVAGPRVEHFGFPWCLHDRFKGGLAGFQQDPLKNPTPSGDCTTLPPAAYTGLDPSATDVATPVALFGMNVSADGLAFNPGTNFPDAYDGDLFVAEWGNLYGDGLAGHKVVRVRFDAAGAVLAIEDFLTGPAPLDLTFAPDGSLWIADYGGSILRVAWLLPNP